MSLNRAAFRLATICALSNNWTEPWPTIAQGRVFDSRLDPRQSWEPGELRPALVVYTEDDNGAALSSNNGGPPWRRMVNLVIEAMLGAVGADDHGLTFDLAVTDAELEGQLDLMEHQVKFALANTLNPWTALLQNGFLIRICDWSSQRFVTSEGQVPLSGRQLTAQVEIRDDDLPVVTSQDPAPAALPANIKALLAAVLADLGDDDQPKGYVKPLIDLLQGAGVPHTVVAPELKSVRLTEQTPAGAPDVEARIENLDQ